MGDEMTDEDSIRAAFMAAYRDLANHGLVRSDEEIADELFQQFKRDLESGFVSVFRELN